MAMGPLLNRTLPCRSFPMTRTVFFIVASKRIGCTAYRLDPQLERLCIAVDNCRPDDERIAEAPPCC